MITVERETAKQILLRAHTAEAARTCQRAGGRAVSADASNDKTVGGVFSWPLGQRDKALALVSKPVVKKAVIDGFWKG